MDVQAGRHLPKPVTAMNASASRGLADDRRAMHGLTDREYRAQDPDTACVCLDNAEQVLADNTAALESDKHDLVVLQTGLEVR